MAEFIKLVWKGNEVYEAATKAIVSGLTEFGIKHETASRSVVSPGRGVLTGTYRRSIHAANSSYNFGRDNVKPSHSSPDRSGKGGGANVKGSKVQIVVGSGMRYARRLEQLYEPIKKGHDRVKSQLPTILEKHAKENGFT